MPQWIDITPSSSTGIKKKDDTKWVDITPQTYKPPEHPFTGPEQPTFLESVGHKAGKLWDKAFTPIVSGTEALPPFRQTPQFQKAMEEFNAEHPISAIPGKFANAGAQFGTSPIGIAAILSEGAIPALAGMGEAGTMTRSVGTIASQVGKGLHQLGGAAMGVAGAKHVVDVTSDPNLNNWQKAGGTIEGLLEMEMGKAGAGVYGHGTPVPRGLGKIGDANVPPPPPPSGSRITVGGLESPQRSFDFGQPEPHLPFHGEPSMEVPVPFEHRWQMQPDYGLLTSIPGQPRTEMQTPRPIEGPEVGPYGTGVGQERLPLQDEFGQGELGLGNLVRPEENPSRMPYERMGADEVPTPKAEGETVAPDATQQPHIISARGMTKADIEMLRTQGYESGGQGADGYAQMIRKAGPLTPATTTTTTPPAPTPPPIASGATSVDVRAGQPVRVPKDALTTQLIERLKAQGFEKIGNDVNGDGLFTRIIKETGGWGDDAAIGDFFRKFFGREPSIEEMADMAVPGDGRKGLFMKITGTIHDTRDPNTLRRQAEILDEQKGIAINNGEIDAAAHLADLHREALESADRLSGGLSNPMTQNQMNDARANMGRGPVDEGRSFSDAVDDLHGQLEGGGVNDEIIKEVQDRIANARDIHEAMDMQSELGAMADNVGHPSMRQIFSDLHDQANRKYYEFVRQQEGQPVPPRVRSVDELSNTLDSMIHHNMITSEDEFVNLADELRKAIENENDPTQIAANERKLRDVLSRPNEGQLHQETFNYLHGIAQERLENYEKDPFGHLAGDPDAYDRAHNPELYDQQGKLKPQPSSPGTLGADIEEFLDHVRRGNVGKENELFDRIKARIKAARGENLAGKKFSQLMLESLEWDLENLKRKGGSPEEIQAMQELVDTASNHAIDDALPEDLTQRPDYNLTGGPNFKASDFPTPKDAMEARQFEIERRYQNFGRARDKYRLPNGDIITVDATATKGIDSFDMGNGQVAEYVGPMGPEDTIDPATGNVVQLDPSGRPKTEPPAGAGEILPEPSGEIEDLRQQNGLEGITGPPTDEPVDLGQTPTLRDFINDTEGTQRNDELGRRLKIPEIRPPKTSIERPEIEYEQARIQALKNPIYVEKLTREYMGERRIAIREKDWDRVHELDKQISQLAERRSQIYSELYSEDPLTARELERRGQQQLPGMVNSVDSGQPLTEMPPQSPTGYPEQRPPTQGQLPMSRRPKIGRIPGLTIDKIKEAEASLAPDRWDPGLDHEWGTRQLEGFLPQKGKPGLSVADINGDTAIGPHDVGQVVYRNPSGTKALVVARLEPLLDGSGKVGVKSLYSKKDGGVAQGRGVIAVLKKLVELDALRVNGDYSSWTRDLIHGLRDFIDDTGGWGDDNQLWENIKRRTGWGQGGKVQPPKLDPQGQPIKELNLLKELIAVPSAATTTGDLSASGRQALPFIFTPEFWKAQWPQLQAGWSVDAFNRINAKLEDLPLFRQRIDLTTGDLKPSLANELGMKLLKPSDHIDEREAAIASRWLETGGNIPGISKLYSQTVGRYIRGSNRAYMTLLNHIRANRTQKLFDLARDMSVKALETGEARPNIFKQKYTPQEALELDPYTNKVLGREIVDFVNTATGRGPLKMHVFPYRKSEISLEGSADKLGYLLFAPRMIASRMRMLNPSTYIMASPFVRKQYLKAAISTAAAWTAINQMGKLAGAETNDDLDSADFGKMRFGDTRLDPAGGFQQFLVAYHRLYTGGYSSSSTGTWHQFGKGFQAQTQYDQGERLFSNKLNPVAKFAWDVLNASEYQPFHVYDRTAQLFVPLIIQDVYELAKEDPSLLPLVAPVAFGMGTQTYSKGESVGKFIAPEDDWLATGGGLSDLLPEAIRPER